MWISPDYPAFYLTKPFFPYGFVTLIPLEARLLTSKIAVLPHDGAQNVILLVDAEVMARNLTAKLLHRDGYLVLSAAHGQEALKLTREYEGRIDLLIATEEMPRMNGRRLCERIRCEQPHIRLLLIAQTRPSDNASDGLPCLVKPFAAVELRQKVKQLLNAAEPL